eukprot:GEMP01039353.1.p1 GENE.GEMP01039353.1~~GEMP01039353.1.p1  ORF type:complete len:463 (+),score=141.64 GEMP01039353.1:57-1445(+)
MVTRPTSAFVAARPGTALPCSARLSIRPQSAGACLRKRYTVAADVSQFTSHVSSSTRALSPVNLDQSDEALRTLRNMQGAFKEMASENAELKTAVQGAEQELQSVLIATRGGRLVEKAKLQKKEMDDLLAHVRRLEESNQALATKQHLAAVKLKEKQFFMRYFQKESAAMRQVAVELQRECMRGGQASMIKELTDKFGAVAKKQISVLEFVRHDSAKQEGKLSVFLEQFQRVDDTVQDLHKMTNKLVQDRAAAAKLISEGREKMEEFQNIYKSLKKELQKMRSEINEVVDTCTRSAETRAKDAKRIDDMARAYKTVLEELVANNKWYKQENADIHRQNEELRAENSELLESLMAYLLLNQKAEFVKNTPCERALGPLCVKASRKRVASPSSEMKLETSRMELETSRKPLSQQLYPPESPAHATQPEPEKFMTKEEAFAKFQLNLPQVLRKARIDGGDVVVEL